MRKPCSGNGVSTHGRSRSVTNIPTLSSVVRILVAIPRHSKGRRSGSGEEAEVGRGESGEVRENLGDGGLGKPEPAGEGGAVLLHGGRRDPATGRVGVIGTRAGKRREASVEIAPAHRPAEDEVVISPRVVGARVGIRLEGAAEIREGERGHVVR